MERSLQTSKVLTQNIAHVIQLSAITAFLESAWGTPWSLAAVSLRALTVDVSEKVHAKGSHVREREKVAAA
jgi:hypothetical protein